MNISEVFIRRPIATSLLMAGIALFGVVAYRGLAVSDLPSVDFPTIQVSVGLPGSVLTRKNGSTWNPWMFRLVYCYHSQAPNARSNVKC